MGTSMQYVYTYCLIRQGFWDPVMVPWATQYERWSALTAVMFHEPLRTISKPGRWERPAACLRRKWSLATAGGLFAQHL